MRIRQTCPLLFGAVICVSSYFLDAPNGEIGLQLYLSLVGLLNETLARKRTSPPSVVHLANHEHLVPATIMSPRNSELDVDFILGVALCIVWKAPRIDKQHMSVSDFPQMQHLAKLNVGCLVSFALDCGR